MGSRKIKKMIIVDEVSKNELKNYTEEWTNSYTYFMVKVQAQEEKDGTPKERPKGG